MGLPVTEVPEVKSDLLEPPIDLHHQPQVIHPHPQKQIIQIPPETEIVTTITKQIINQRKNAQFGLEDHLEVEHQWPLRPRIQITLLNKF